MLRPFGRVFTLGAASAEIWPLSTTLAACVSLAFSWSALICCIRKNPSTVTTSAEMTSVVVITRSCSDRSQRARRTPCARASRRRRAANRRRASRRSRRAAFGSAPGTSAPRRGRRGALPTPLVAAPFMPCLR